MQGDRADPLSGEPMKVRDRERLTEMLATRLPRHRVRLDGRCISISITRPTTLGGTSRDTVFVNLTTIRGTYKGPGWRQRLVSDVGAAIEPSLANHRPPPREVTTGGGDHEPAEAGRSGQDPTKSTRPDAA